MRSRPLSRRTSGTFSRHSSLFTYRLKPHVSPVIDVLSTNHKGAFEMAYEPREYPKMKYHAKHGARTVNNAEEEQALGSGWVKHPDELDEQKHQEREQSERDEELARRASRSTPPIPIRFCSRCTASWTVGPLSLCSSIYPSRCRLRRFRINSRTR